TNASINENGDINLTFDYNPSGAGCWFGMQLFYKDSALTVGEEYTLKMNINSPVDGKITVNGTVVTLKAGDNQISVNYTEPDKASISIQFGVNELDDQSNYYALAGGSFTISNVSISPASATAPGTGGEAGTGGETGSGEEAGSGENVSSVTYFYTVGSDDEGNLIMESSESGDTATFAFGASCALSTISSTGFTVDGKTVYVTTRVVVKSVSSKAIEINLAEAATVTVYYYNGGGSSRSAILYDSDKKTVHCSKTMEANVKDQSLTCELDAGTYYFAGDNDISFCIITITYNA
ncbi:MAG: hypothetical protein ACI4RF_06080, partial [Eubacterium sp.]